MNNPIITDKNDREIKLGDTLKVFHFIGARRKRHYMYKQVACDTPKSFRVSHLNLDNDFYHIAKDNKKHPGIEIVQSAFDIFEHRPKIKLEVEQND